MDVEHAPIPVDRTDERGVVFIDLIEVLISRQRLVVLPEFGLIHEPSSGVVKEAL